MKIEIIKEITMILVEYNDIDKLIKNLYHQYIHYSGASWFLCENYAEYLIEIHRLKEVSVQKV